MPIYGRRGNAVQSDALRGIYIRQAKNDSRDSFIIAEVVRFGRFCETAVSAPDLHALRELCRHRFWIVDSVSDLKRKVIALLDQVFPEYEKLFTNTFGKTSLLLLSEYTTPEELLAYDSIALLIRQYIEQIRFVETQIDAIDAEIARPLAAFDNQLTIITGITPVSLYELRHTFVSVAQALPEGLVKKLVGHSQSMDTLGHLRPSRGRPARGHRPTPGINL